MPPSKKKFEKKEAILSLSLLIFSVFMFITLLFIIFIAMIQGRTQGGLILSDGVGIIEINGVIAGSKRVNQQLDGFNKTSGIEAIVLRVNSPGGAVGPVQEIYDKIIEVKQKKPVVVSFGTVSASGGYYVATAANQIVANAGSITGSIGVIMKFVDLQRLYDYVKVKQMTIKSGKFKDIGASSRGMTADEKVLLQGVVDDAYEQFIEAIVLGRAMDDAAARKYADGRIFTGRQALSYGLVDKLGSLSEAIKLAAELADIDGEPKVIYPVKKEPRLNLRDLLRGSLQNFLGLSLPIEESLSWDTLGPVLYLMR